MRRIAQILHARQDLQLHARVIGQLVDLLDQLTRSAWHRQDRRRGGVLLGDLGQVSDRALDRHPSQMTVPLVYVVIEQRDRAPLGGLFAQQISDQLVGRVTCPDDHRRRALSQGPGAADPDHVLTRQPSCHPTAQHQTDRHHGRCRHHRNP